MTARLPVDELLRLIGADTPEIREVLRETELGERSELAAEEAEELRVAALLVRDLGVNAAGVDVVLRLRRRLLCLEGRMDAVLRRLLDEMERQ